LITTASSNPNYLPVQCRTFAILHPIQSLDISEQCYGVIFFTISCLNSVSKYLSDDDNDDDDDLLLLLLLLLLHYNFDRDLAFSTKKITQ